MADKRKPTFSEVRVGIFVVVTCVILAIAIFTIGTQVGLFEKTFTAMTYLNNVSGLKPGDVVLLAGVEVGNVTDVEISSPGHLPETQTNQQLLAKIDELQNRVNQLREKSPADQSRLSTLQTQLTRVVRTAGANSTRARELRREAQNLTDLITKEQADLQKLESEIKDARSGLQNIVVYMQIKSQYRNWIRDDSNISLGSIGLLGDKYIEISLGRSPNPPPVKVTEVDTWLGKKKKETVIVTGITQAGFEQLITGANDILANFETLSNQLNSIMDRITEGEGSVGKFFVDPAFYNNLNDAVLSAKKTIEDASVLISDLREGSGTVPMLIRDRQLYDKISAAADRLEDVAARVDQGRGTLGKLVRDASLYDSTDKTMGHVEQITARIAAGEGTLGKLSKDDRVYTQLQSSLDQLNGFLTDIENGKGTLGRLAKDKQLYDNLNQLSAEMVKLIYDFRQNPKKFLTIKFEIF